ncbi:MAG: hypothetical protein IJD58_00955 [Lachnospiraceae bacterium]|nr:hypothetical protein [Lachnospiraceae bacterium]
MDNFNNNQNQYSHNYSGVSESLLGGNEAPTYDTTYDTTYDATYNTSYDSVYHEPVAPKKPKKKKWLIITGIIVAFVAIIVMVAVNVVGQFFETFEVDDFDKVNEACEEVFGESFTVTQLNSNYGKGDLVYKINQLGTVVGTKEKAEFTVYWFEFDDETSARTRMEVLDLEYDIQHEELQRNIGNSSRISTTNKIEWKYIYSTDIEVKCIKFFAMTGKYAVEVEITGDEKQVDKLFKSFKKKIK